MMDCVHGKGVERGAWKRGRAEEDGLRLRRGRFAFGDGGQWRMGRLEREDGRWKMEDGLGPEVPTPQGSRSQRLLEPADQRSAPQPEQLRFLVKRRRSWLDCLRDALGRKPGIWI